MSVSRAHSIAVPYFSLSLASNNKVRPTYPCRKERMDRIKRLRWQQRSLSEDIKQNFSQSEIEVGCSVAML